MKKDISTTAIVLHRSCNTLSLEAFICAYCREDYSVLGKGSKEAIAEAWLDILCEWKMLMKSEDGDYMFDMAKRILILKSEITFIESAVFYLKLRYDQEMIDQLKALDFPGEFPEDNYDEYVRQLDLVLTLTKRKVWDLNELNDEYEKLRKDQGEKSTEEDFNKTISRLSKYQGYRIDKANTTVTEYATIHSNFINDHKSHN